MAEKVLVLATTNQGKLREYQAMLSDLELSILTLADYPEIGEIVEDGQSFSENALIKARAVAKLTHKLAVADDSGLMVDYLDGAPGIYSARFAGESRSDQKNNEKLLSLLTGVKEREAQFCCAIAIVFPDGYEEVVEGICRGEITTEAIGKEGFGYDPLFWVASQQKTFAQLTMEEKNAISHRGKANSKLINVLKKYMEVKRYAHSNC